MVKQTRFSPARLLLHNPDSFEAVRARGAASRRLHLTSSPVRNYVPIRADPAGKMMLLPRQGGGSARAPDALLLVVLLAAAAASLGAAKDTAFVEVVLFESSPNGDYTTYTTGLQGRFSKAGATISAEGEIVQVSARDSGLEFYRASNFFFHRGRGLGVGGEQPPRLPACLPAWRGGGWFEACKHMRSQDGSYLLEFIHGETCFCKLFSWSLQITSAHFTHGNARNLEQKRFLKCVRKSLETFTATF